MSHRAANKQITMNWVKDQMNKGLTMEQINQLYSSSDTKDLINNKINALTA